MERTLDQRLKGYLAETEDGCLLFLGHWDANGSPRFFTIVDDKRVIFNIKKYLYKRDAGIDVGNDKLVRSCSSEKCVSPEHHLIVK